MSQAFYLKWRPISWEQIVSQEHVVQTLRNAVAADRVAHAHLFAGPRGTGKTTTARLLAKSVNCLQSDLAARPCNHCDHCQAINHGRFLDLIEIDAASNTSVDDVRDLREKINFSPNQGRFKVYIIDEVHMLSTAAFNALLKTLEEPPAHAIFILATTEVHKIPATVLSRCQYHEFRYIPVNDIVTHLEEIAEGEGIDVEKEALTLIARQSTGSLRDGVSLLDQLSSANETITLELAQNVLGTAASQSVIDIVKAILSGQAASGLDQIHKSLDAGSDPRQLARQIIDYLRNLLLIQMSGSAQIDVTAEIRKQMTEDAAEFEISDLLQVIDNFNNAAANARNSWQPSLPLEMAFIASLNTPHQESSKAHNQVKSSAVESSQSDSPATDQQTDVKTPASKAENVQNTTSPDEDPQSQVLDDNWRKILNHVKQQNPNTYGLLNSSRLHFIKGDILVLGFTSKLLKEKMDKEDNLKVIQQALSDVLEMELTIKCIVTSAEGNSIPAGVDRDGMVAAALRDLGGKIVDIQ